MWNFIKNIINPVPKHSYTVVELTYFAKNKVVKKSCHVRKEKESGSVEILTVKNTWIPISKAFKAKKSRKMENKIEAAFIAKEIEESDDSEDSRQTYWINVIRPITSGSWAAITSLIPSLSLNASLTDVKNSLIANE